MAESKICKMLSLASHPRAGSSVIITFAILGEKMLYISCLSYTIFVLCESVKVFQATLLYKLVYCEIAIRILERYLYEKIHKSYVRCKFT